jgi:Rieske Fe-S protein
MANPPDSSSRREFLRVAVVGGAALLGAGVGAWTILDSAIPAPGAQTLPLAPLLRLAGLEKGKPLALSVTLSRRDGWRLRSRTQHVFVVRTAEGDTADAFSALSPVCPHKGCNVETDEKTGEFVCPCHDARFDFTGEYKEGPAARGMDPLELSTGKHEGQDWLFVKWQDFELGTEERAARS